MLRLGLGLALLNSDDAAQGRPLLQQALEQLGNRADCRSRMLEDARHQLAAGTVPHQSIRPQGVRPAMVVRR